MTATDSATPKRVLVTNDDGIDADGIRVLIAALVEHGYDPLVVAPDADYSGAGTSILSLTPSEEREIRYERRVLPEAPNAEAYALGGPPALCALLTMRGAFGERPGLVASGINFGLNTGPAVRHSGTVSAAITSASFGVPSIALSSEFNFDKPDDPLRYDTAARVGMKLLDVISESGHLALSLNVPQCSFEELAGVRSAVVGTVSRFQSYVEERTDEVLKLGYQIIDEPVGAETDIALVKAGFATVSSLHGPGSVDCFDLIERLAEAAA